MYQNRSGFLGPIPPVTKNLIIINALIWFASIVFPIITKYLGLHYLSSEDFNPAQFITYIFMHGSFSHVFFNMFAVFMFGRTLEMVWGAKRYLIFYFVTGIGAGLIQELVLAVRIYQITGQLFPDLLAFLNQHGENMSHLEIGRLVSLVNSVTVGASGAVFGLLLAFGMLFPNAEIFIMFIPVPIKAKYFVILYGIAELYFGIADYGGDNVAHFAHLGGMLFGFFLIRYWRKKDINDRDINNNGGFFR